MYSSGDKQPFRLARRKVNCDAQYVDVQLRKTVIVVVGLAFEARIAVDTGAQVICGGDGRNLTALLARAITEDCRGFISFGVAGGLSSDLPAGTCVVGSEIQFGTFRFVADRNWSQNLLQAIPDAIYGKILGVSAPVAYSAAKRALFADTGAVAVDMETHIVASVAAANNLPFAAIRVITDPAERTLPQIALAAMRPNGTIDIAAMIHSVIKHPRELRALLQTTLDALAARATLRRIRQALGSVLDEADVKEPELNVTQDAMASPSTTAKYCPLVVNVGISK
jgi:hopanoid-associated phosphorylase